MDNQAIASVFEEMARLLEFKGENPFRIRAYVNGAQAIRQLEEPVAAILKDPQRDLAKIPGIGKTLVEKTKVLVETGGLPQLETLREEISPVILAMSRIPGLGAKKAVRLREELGIESLDDLRAACQDGRVAKLKGFGPKSQEGILEGLSIAEQAAKRMRYAGADRLVDTLDQHMRSCPAVKRLEFAGSYRRGRETVGDLDLLVVAEDHAAVMDHFEAFPQRSQTIMRGDTKISIRVDAAFQVDLRVVAANQFGAALQYFTGSQAHNIQVRKLAIAKGLKVNEYGVFPDGSEDSITGGDEAEVYEAIGLPWIPPELREHRDEFKWAEKKTLPKLVELDDIVGDMHMHTDATDGQNTLEEMIEAAIDRGLQYIAITDHSQRVSMAGGLDAARASAQWKKIAKLRDRYAGQIQVLTGIECDILEAGGMDLPDDVLAMADWVLGSIHYGQKQSREKITERILGAIENPHVDCIAHPTGRLINRRPSYEVDMHAVMDAAKAHKTFLELNANPARLDLNDEHLAMARKRGIPIVISTDAHSIANMDLLRYGIVQARRGGLTAAQIANTHAWSDWPSLWK
ncbi:MAG: DNA polymerase/3'-5' exonuclease PolX [Planctomycetota bacterium]